MQPVEQSAHHPSRDHLSKLVSELSESEAVGVDVVGSEGGGEHDCLNGTSLSEAGSGAARLGVEKDAELGLGEVVCGFGFGSEFVVCMCIICMCVWPWCV